MFTRRSAVGDGGGEVRGARRKARGARWRGARRIEWSRSRREAVSARCSEQRAVSGGVATSAAHSGECARAGAGAVGPTGRNRAALSPPPCRAASLRRTWHRTAFHLEESFTFYAARHEKLWRPNITFELGRDRSTDRLKARSRRTILIRLDHTVALIVLASVFSVRIWLRVKRVKLSITFQ